MGSALLGPMGSSLPWPDRHKSVGQNERKKIVMTDDEIVEFIDRSRTATMATVLADGRPHLVAMWYAVLDGEIWFETKAKSQKAEPAE